MLCRSRFQPIFEETRLAGLDKAAETTPTAGGKGKKKKKTERETTNCCKISQYIDANVAALDGWQSGGWLQGFAAREHENLWYPMCATSDNRKHAYNVC